MKGVVLAAGKGERLKPLTETRPKHLIPIAGKPVVDYAVENLLKNNVKPLYIVVSYMKEKIMEYFKEKQLKVEFIEQREQLGTGDAILQVEGRVKGNFMVYYGDIVTDPENIRKVLLEAEKNKKPVLGLAEVKKPELYGVVTLKNGKVAEIEEKPLKPRSNLVLSGIYVLPREVFRYLKGLAKSMRGEYELTDALREMINDGFEFTGVKLQKEWVDIGAPWDLLKANRYILQRKTRHEINGEIERNVLVKGKVYIGENTKVKSGSYIEGPVYIGKNCEIGPNCYIRPFTSIEDKVKIGGSVEVKNSVILEGTKVPHLTYIGDSLIGSECNFGAGTIVANLRLDHGEIKVKIKGKKIGSGLRKLGVIMGDKVETGINVSFMPGVKVGSNTLIGANTVVIEDIPSNTLVYSVQKMVFKERKQVK